MTYQLPPLQAALTASAALLTAIGGPNPAGQIAQSVYPETYSRPYVVWSIVSGQPENFLQGEPDEDDIRCQVDCYSAQNTQCRQMMQAAVAACEGIGHIVFGPIVPGFDEGDKLFRWLFQVEVWNRRTP